MPARGAPERSAAVSASAGGGPVVLGLCAFTHDSSACLLIEGTLVGFVEELGPGCSRLKVGDRIGALTVWGADADRVCLP